MTGGNCVRAFCVKWDRLVLEEQGLCCLDWSWVHTPTQALYVINCTIRHRSKPLSERMYHVCEMNDTFLVIAGTPQVKGIGFHGSQLIGLLHVERGPTWQRLHRPNCCAPDQKDTTGRRPASQPRTDKSRGPVAYLGQDDSLIQIHDLLIACAAVQRVCSPVDLCATLGEKTGRGREEMHSREKSEADEILYNQSSLHFQASGELSGVSHSNVMYHF
ncbi:hypothetical protein F2P81_013570 [Scophthalmus maximus]|uniref:Uncharacterized protein n=1 Tax=Scophthalmus maximus TaxID=52904 RepID=A0A6A4SR44_SCOMX|nr:hypothetical protein F2P81_013570 [Scophthalmus maximus]